MRTEVRRVYPCPSGSKQALDTLLNGTEFCFAEIPSGDAGLIRYDNDPNAGSI
jgi:hypothetical protein